MLKSRTWLFIRVIKLILPAGSSLVIFTFIYKIYQFNSFCIVQRNANFVTFADCNSKHIKFELLETVFINNNCFYIRFIVENIVKE